MLEQLWHKETREKLVAEFKKSETRVESSHGGDPNLELFKDLRRRENCLSDADIVVIDSDGKIKRIVEIESELNPKKLIGIVIGTHFCTKCARGDEEFPLEDISLEIYYRKPHSRSKKALKLDVLKQPLDQAIKQELKGCLRDFSWKPYE